MLVSEKNWLSECESQLNKPRRLIRLRDLEKNLLIRSGQKSEIWLPHFIEEEKKFHWKHWRRSLPGIIPGIPMVLSEDEKRKKIIIFALHLYLLPTYNCTIITMNSIDSYDRDHFQELQEFQEWIPLTAITEITSGNSKSYKRGRILLTASF